MTEELRAHVRYPEDMFRVQSDMYATYHQLDPQDFFQDEDKWDVPSDPSTSDRGLVRGDTVDQFGNLRLDNRPSLPYYLLMKLPGEDQLSYLILQSFNPASRENMTAFMVAKSGPDEYGKIVDYRLPRGRLINGLQQISARIDQDPVHLAAVHPARPAGLRDHPGQPAGRPVRGVPAVPSSRYT